MHEKLLAVLPEFTWLNDNALRHSVIATYQEAIQTANLKVEDMGSLAFFGKGHKTSFSYLEYVHEVAGMCNAVVKERHIHYAEQVGYSLKGLLWSLDYDTLLAGALLHDIGKLVEYELTPDGSTIQSKTGKYVRHPFYGAAIAYKNGVPASIIHIIAMHSYEGDGKFRSPEALALIKIINFKMAKARLNINLPTYQFT